ncbi:MAG: nucleotide exchange factor GrpE [Peptococcaceae bacterium]|nr:nucleotide exchange factor GrpE [Peptococcaceae bacterium]
MAEKEEKEDKKEKETVQEKPKQTAEIVDEENLEEDNEEGHEEDNVFALEAELEQAKAKADEYYSHLQRLKAEFDNFRRRTVREKEEIAKYASERIILSLLPVLDNFERALESAKSNQDFDAFSQGVEMIFRQLMKVLEEEGLKPIEALGEQFDPNLHEAMFREESDQEENTILEELQKGYYLKDKVIRPSRVKVSG